ncbi:energy transducer TonB [Sulfitobacter sp. SK012]|uniref:cell envelope integrity protein TolA n=1 Tax=Sulfitobacter sp. SK012 TaxID=1389005 RepID=UPI000E0A0ABC|nr:cell envelope integrity protein TolA [Sulfitobacter sp. SK012]AXI46500.1 energy transducer TonB [Sulfitobacter sp. SK012]
MIRRSTAIAAAAILLSLLVHFLGLGFAPPIQPQPSTEETTSDVVRVGNAFEDVAETLSEPVAPENTPSPEPEPATEPEPEPADTPTSEALVASSNPQQTVSPDTGSAQAVQPQSTGPSEPEEGQVPDPETVEPSGETGTPADLPETSQVEPETIAEAPKGEPLASVEPVETITAEPVPSPPVAPPVTQQLAALPPEAIAPALPVTPAPEPSAIPVIPLGVETVAPETPETTVDPTPNDAETEEAEDEGTGSDLAVVSSKRPQSPPPRPAGDSSGDAQRTPPPLIESPLAAYQRNGTDLNFKQNGGTRSGGIGFQNSGGNGNSNVTNYAGSVLVHLNRVETVRVSGQGFAWVKFEINPDGTLGWVDIIDSSGSQEIDRAAEAQVRNAAPFPLPPEGASRRLAFFYRIY